MSNTKDYLRFELRLFEKARERLENVLSHYLKILDFSALDSFVERARKEIEGDIREGRER